MDKEKMSRQWLDWAKELQAIGQIGLAYSKDKYDLERFQRIRDISAEILSLHTEIKAEVIRDLFANETGYNTPKVEVRAVVLKDNQVLLVKEEGDGRWSLPGGWADIQYSIAENVKKECMEESGVAVHPEWILAVYDRKKHHETPFPYEVYCVFVACRYVGGSHQENIETTDSGFFPLDQLPDLSVGRNTYDQLYQCVEAIRQNNRITYFD